MTLHTTGPVPTGNYKRIDSSGRIMQGVNVLFLQYGRPHDAGPYSHVSLEVDPDGLLLEIVIRFETPLPLADAEEKFKAVKTIVEAAGWTLTDGCCFGGQPVSKKEAEKIDRSVANFQPIEFTLKARKDAPLPPTAADVLNLMPQIQTETLGRTLVCTRVM